MSTAVTIQPYSNSAKPLGFLDLPAEIKNMIYKHALGPGPDEVNKEITDTKASQKFKVQGWQSRFRSTKDVRMFLHEQTRFIEPEAGQLALLSTCQQVRKEAMTYYFHPRTFVFAETHHMCLYLHLIGEEYRNHIRHVEFWFQGTDRIDAFKYLASMTGHELEKLHINFMPRLSRLAYKQDPNGGLNIDAIPGMKALRAVKGCKEVIVARHFFNDCEALHFGPLKRMLHRELRQKKPEAKGNLTK
ncbi:hypothetical protein B0J14DRAFT_666985 [Halenospora varia]|nr:hypothetical protein B0J14DRAFT_666985 [Halenospora varia]